MSSPRPRQLNGVSHNHRCPAVSIDLSLITAPVEAAAEANDARLSYHACNVTDAEGIASTFASITPSLRYPIRGLVDCAGISYNGPSIDFPAHSIRRLLDVNVTGTFLVAQAVARQMVEANVSGSIVLVASMSGYVSNKVDEKHLCHVHQLNYTTGG